MRLDAAGGAQRPTLTVSVLRAELPALSVAVATKRTDTLLRERDLRSALATRVRTERGNLNLSEVAEPRATVTL